MIDGTLKRQLLADIERLSAESLARVYEYTHSLASTLPRGASVDELMALAGTIDDESAREMTAAIDEACEQVEPNAW